VQERSKRRLGCAALVAGAAAIGLAPIWVRLSEVGPSATAFYRLLLALPILCLWTGVESRRTNPPPRPATRKEFALLAAAGAFFALDLAMWHWSIKLTSVANATLFANFAPLFVAVGARYLLAERLTPLFLGGMVAALAGGALLVGVSLTQTLEHLAGDAFGVATAVFYGAYQLSVKCLRHRFSTATTLAWSGLAACPVLWAAALAAHEVLVPQTRTGWLVLVALALTAQLGGQGLIAYASAHLSASFLSVALLVQPVAAAGFAWVLLHERMGPAQVLGGLVVLLGIGMAGWARRAAPEP